MHHSQAENHSAAVSLRYLNGHNSVGPSQTTNGTHTAPLVRPPLVTDLGDLGDLYRSPVSPSDGSSPSLEADSDEEDDSSDGSPGPTLQMMGENQVRKSRASQAHLGLRVAATSRPRLFLTRAPDRGDAFGCPETIRNEHRNPLPIQVAPASISWSPARPFCSDATYTTPLVTDTGHLADPGDLYRSPVSPSDDSMPSSEADSDEEDDSSDGSPGPTLQMMGENQVRKSRATQAHLGLRVPATSRPRLLSDPLARAPDSGDAFGVNPETIQNEHQISLPVQVAPANISWSPAMAFLRGLNSPFAGPSSPIASPAPIRNQGPVEERIGPYVLGAVIGHGGFSVVRKGTSASGVVAVKIVPVPITQDTKSSLENEISIWSSLHHEYVLPLFMDYRTDDNIYLVSLYCPAGSLFDILRLHGVPGLPQDDVSTMFRQIVRGLRYLHEQMQLVHGDIKLENVLVDELGACRIADFGLTRYITTPSESDVRKNVLPPHLRGRAFRHRNSTHVPGLNKQSSLHHFLPGSLPYAAPELLLPPTSSQPHADDAHSGNSYPANPAQDVWALGCLLHALLFGRLPFADSYEPRLQMKIVRGAWERGHSGTRSRSRARGSKSRSVGRIRSSSRDKRVGTRFQHNSKPRITSKSRSNDVKIGKEARRVLRGCICVDVERRWTVAQIDEAAWNAGWDAADEIAESDEVSQDSTDKRPVGTLSRDGSFKSRNDIMSEQEWLTEPGDGMQQSTPFARDGAHPAAKKTPHRSETTR